ncbi:unnamed protein product [Brassica napus]|nr:unnamed protein product [Brassica napus]
MLVCVADDRHVVNFVFFYFNLSPYLAMETMKSTSSPPSIAMESSKVLPSSSLQNSMVLIKDPSALSLTSVCSKGIEALALPRSDTELSNSQLPDGSVISEGLSSLSLSNHNTEGLKEPPSTVITPPPSGSVDPPSASQYWSDDEYDEYGVYQTDIDTELLSSRKVKTKYYLHTPIASINEIGVAEAINIVTSIAFLIAFAILRIQPVNDIAYFPKWYLKGLRTSSIQTALQMPEPELVRSRFCCLLEDLRTRVQDFFPIARVAFTTMVHVNWKNKGLDGLKHSNISYSDIDKLSLSNIPNGSDMRCQPRCLRLRRKNENPGGRNLVLELLVVRGPLEEGRRAIGRSLSDDEPPEDGAKGVL